MNPKTRRGTRVVHHYAKPAAAAANHTNGAPTGARRSSFSDVSDGEEAHEENGKSAVAGTDVAAAAAAERRAEYEKKKANFLTRTLWTFVMMTCLFGALLMGHIYIILLVTVVQVVSFKEVIAIASVPSRARQLRINKSINWYFLATTMLFLYGESVIYYFRHIVLVDRVLLPLATHHRFISFLLYVFGFVFFVASLQADHYRFQFTQFAWTHMALFLIVVQAHFIMNNVFEGMVWFFLPAALVITNDIFAYLFGITFGRTQLIKLSPKKTVEGFVGAWGATVVAGMVLAGILMRSSYFTCPASDLGANVFTGLDCVPNPVFVAREYRLPPLVFLPPALANLSITVTPMQFHTLFFATFASLIAPFGGFFASGLKRTFKIKDFGDSIPGHGGITDRMDCQFLFGTFTYIYYHTFIASHRASLGDVIETAITGLTHDQLLDLVRALARYLANQRVLAPDFAAELAGYLIGRGGGAQANLAVARDLLSGLVDSGSLSADILPSFDKALMVGSS